MEKRHGDEQAVGLDQRDLTFKPRRRLQLIPLIAAGGKIMGIDDRFWRSCCSRGMYDDQWLASCFLKSLGKRIVRVRAIKELVKTRAIDYLHWMHLQNAGYHWRVWCRRRKQNFAFGSLEKTNMIGDSIAR